MLTKEALIKKIAHYQAKMFQKRFDKIGNIYKTSMEAAQPTQVPKTNSESESTKDLVTPPEVPFNLSRMVSLILFWGDHVTRDIPRGPFYSSYDWLHTRLNLAIADQDRILKESDDEDDIEDAENAKDIAVRLLGMLPDIFPPSDV